MTSNQENKLKKIVLDYLQGEAITNITVRLQTQSTELGTNCNHAYKAILITPNDPFVKAMLGRLNIPASDERHQKLLEKSHTLYDLLTNLYHDGNHHIGTLLKLIATTKIPRNWTLFLLISTIVSGAAGAAMYFRKELIHDIGIWFENQFPEIINWLGKTFSLLKNITLLGIIYNSLLLASSWYETFTNGTTSKARKFKTFFFKTLSSSFTLSAYLLSYFAEGTMALPIAALFVLSSSVDVFKSMYYLIKHKHALTILTPRCATDKNWAASAEYERAFNLHQRSLRSVWIRLSAAIFTTIAVGIWCFSPPSLIVTITSLVFINLIALTKSSLLASIYNYAADNIQKKLAVIDVEIPIELSPSEQAMASGLERKQAELATKEKQLTNWEQRLIKEEADFKLRQNATTEVLPLHPFDKELSSPAQALLALQQHPVHPNDKTTVSKEPLLADLKKADLGDLFVNHAMFEENRSNDLMLQNNHCV